MEVLFLFPDRIIIIVFVGTTISNATEIFPVSSHPVLFVMLQLGVRSLIA